jgi:hypothetical protein
MDVAAIYNKFGLVFTVIRCWCCNVLALVTVRSGGLSVNFRFILYSDTLRIMQKNDDLKQFPATLDEMDDVLLQAAASSLQPDLLFSALRAREYSQRLLLEASSVQWLATWCRTLHGLVQIEHEPTEAPLEVLRRVSDTLPGAIVGLLPDKSIQQMTRQSLARFRDAYFRTQLEWPDLDVHASASLLCVDTLPPDIALPPLLYPNRATLSVAERDHFCIVTDKLISAVTQEKNIRGAINIHRDRLTTVLHELFKNTHDHARTGTDRRSLPLSIRGLYSRFYTARRLEETLKLDANGARPNQSLHETLNQVEQYAAHFLTSGRQRAEGVRQKAPSVFLGLLELSIFDTGPGLAATYLKEKFAVASVQEQFDAVIGCFQTGKSSTDDESRGYGLWKVLRDLRAMKGFIRVRTNRINVYRDFARFEDMWIKRDSIVAPEERLLDWKRGLTSKIDEGYPDVQGASISILIPLGEGL